MNLTAAAMPLDTTKLFLDIARGNPHILSSVDDLNLIKSNRQHQLYDEEDLTRSDIMPFYTPPFNDSLMLAVMVRDPLNDIFITST